MNVSTCGSKPTVKMMGKNKMNTKNSKKTKNHFMKFPNMVVYLFHFVTSLYALLSSNSTLP